MHDELIQKFWFHAHEIYLKRKVTCRIVFFAIFKISLFFLEGYTYVCTSLT